MLSSSILTTFFVSMIPVIELRGVTRVFPGAPPVHALSETFLTVERGEYTHEDKIGEAQKMRIVWRYDYFLAFDNLYDFYPRRVDDEAGFDAELPPLPRERVALRARVVLDYVAGMTDRYAIAEHQRLCG